MERLPEYKLELIPQSEEAKQTRHFSENCWKDLGYRFKLGGTPDFIQGEDWPICPHCHQKMSFYAQLDAIGESIDIADCGMIYVFLCFDCYETKSIVQSY